MLIERVRRYTDLPLLVGFGISNREQAASVVAAGADGVASGSAFSRSSSSSSNCCARAGKLNRQAATIATKHAHTLRRCLAITSSSTDLYVSLGAFLHRTGASAPVPPAIPHFLRLG